MNARDLSVRLADLLHRERAALAEFLVQLADFDRRRLWVDLGHASLFYFLHRELCLSKGAAFYRKTAAELIQRFPELIEPLRDGRLCLTSVVELSKVLTPENRDDVLPRFFRLSKREAKEVSAALQPLDAAPRRAVVTTVRVPVAVPVAATASAGASGRRGCVATPASAGESGRGCVDRQAEPTEAAPSSSTPADGTGMSPVCPGLVTHVPGSDPTTSAVVHPDEPRRANSPEPGSTPRAASASPAAPRPAAEPLTADLSRLHVTVSRRFLEKLEGARAALSHSHPGAGAHEILEAGLDLLIERHAKRKGVVARPRREPPPANPEHVPAHVRRAVWARDGGRCQWALASGGICGSTQRVEIDHVVPRKRGGPPTIENTRLLCRVHNDLAARRVYGDAWMNRFTPGRAGPSPTGAAKVVVPPQAPVPTSCPSTR